MNFSFFLAGLLFVVPGEKPSVADDIAALKKPSLDPRVNRAAWDRLVANGPVALLPILRSWPVDPVPINWFRTAFDQIAKNNPDKLPVEELIAFASDTRANGKARRAALAAIERVRPGTAAKLFGDWFDDPEFGSDAVASRLAAVEAATDPREQLLILRETLAVANDLEQAAIIAKRLVGAGEKPDVRTHRGIVSQWHVVGPFPVSPELGLTQSFPPEDKISLTAEYEGKSGKLKWVAATNDPIDGRLDLAKVGVKPDEGAVAYAVATIFRDEAAKVELRLSVVDNATVWVNGKKIFERASDYRSIFRIDRYREPVDLPQGKSTILVKLTKTRPDDPKSPIAVRWQFLVRLVDDRGRAIAFHQGEEKK